MKSPKGDETILCPTQEPYVIRKCLKEVTEYEIAFSRRSLENFANHRRIS